MLLQKDSDAENIIGTSRAKLESSALLIPHLPKDFPVC